MSDECRPSRMMCLRWLALIRLDAPQPTISLLDSLPGEDALRFRACMEFKVQGLLCLA